MTSEPKPRPFRNPISTKEQGPTQPNPSVAHGLYSKCVCEPCIAERYSALGRRTLMDEFVAWVGSSHLHLTLRLWGLYP